MATKGTVATTSSSDGRSGSTDGVALQSNPVGTGESRQATTLTIQSIITQTDASGQATRLAAPTYDIEDGDSSAARRRQPNQAPSTTSSWLLRFFCCFQPSRNTLTRSTVQSVRNMNNTSTSSSSASSSASAAPSNGYHPPVPVENRNRPVKYPNTKTILPQNVGKKCLALDLDETLVHSSFQPVPSAHYVIPVTIDGMVHNVFVIKRPGVDDFLKRLSEHYEILVYTASLAKYADPLLDKLDVHKVICNRLFRENCVFHDGHYVKDLSLLNRDLKQTIIVDNSTMSYIFHPENAIDCGTFIDDPNDIEMWQIADFLIGIKDVDDVRTQCRHWREWCRTHPTSAPRR